MNSEVTAWRTSSYSGTQGGNCVEVAGHDGMILVRDTKDHGHGHVHDSPRPVAPSSRRYTNGSPARTIRPAAVRQ